MRQIRYNDGFVFSQSFSIHRPYSSWTRVNCPAGQVRSPDVSVQASRKKQTRESLLHAVAHIVAAKAVLVRLKCGKGHLRNMRTTDSLLCPKIDVVRPTRFE